jgi:hypothetical protein
MPSKTRYSRKDGREDGSEERRGRRRKLLLDDLRKRHNTGK